MDSIQHAMGRRVIASIMDKSVLAIIYAIHFLLQIIYLCGLTIKNAQAKIVSTATIWPFKQRMGNPATNPNSSPRRRSSQPDGVGGRSSRLHLLSRRARTHVLWEFLVSSYLNFRKSAERNKDIGRRREVFPARIKGWINDNEYLFL